jgi:hypothetical protein
MTRPGVHSFRLECNTAMSVMVYYTPPGVRVLHLSRISNIVGTADAPRIATGCRLSSEARLTRAKRIVPEIKMFSWYSG